MSHDHTSLPARLAAVSLAAVAFAVPQFISLSSWAVSSPAPAATASPSGPTSQSASPASDAVAKVQAQLDAANAKLDEATKNLTEAQAGRDEAAAQSDASARGFFTWLAIDAKQDADAVADAKQAVRVLNGEVDGIENAYSATEIGARNDATSIDNVKSAVKLIRTANTLRAADGLGPLKINSALMASAQVNANARQANPTQEIDDYLGLGWKENVSSGQSDPLDGWYTQQKKLWDAGDKSSEKTVNYRNLSDPTLTLTGLGLNTAGDKAPSTDQLLIHATTLQYGYDVDAYQALLDQYLAQAVPQLADLQAKVDAAQDAVAAAKKGVADAEKALEDARRNADTKPGADESPSASSSAASESPTPGEPSVTPSADVTPGTDTPSALPSTPSAGTPSADVTPGQDTASPSASNQASTDVTPGQQPSSPSAATESASSDDGTTPQGAENPRETEVSESTGTPRLPATGA
ncbi:CAP domain-containing protein [Cutibacterium granulosum]|uniref:CAP domain-containing protein n=1 Tax=Cutibacterium granulosum TaxID=33011 RepID=UPI002573BF09|nr:CAP domain-containing protein [Cutibacterium granulosum]MDU4678072.1 CAP domain-containing protein [Cutibacterium granulosum]MDU7727215.1 CAP domain-containing protein [Cutibacterium granulosum]